MASWIEAGRHASDDDDVVADASAVGAEGVVVAAVADDGRALSWIGFGDFWILRP